MTGNLRLGIDIGGTFTDLAVYDPESGDIRFAKLLSTPENLTAAVLACVQKSGTELSSVDLFIHGSTIGINTIIERTGADTALITTAGFRDVLEMGRRDRPDIYDLLFHRPRPLIDRARVLEVPERLNASGEVLVPLERDAIVTAIAALKGMGVASLAVCFLHSYANSAHEEAVESVVRELAPDIPITLSSSISREFREYERASTTVINAYLRGAVGDYLEELEKRFAENGFSGRTLIMQSSGGNMALQAASRQPVRTIESGPAGGVAGALWLCKSEGWDDAIAFDMGGTTAKACLIQEGEAPVTTDYHVGGRIQGYPVQVPFLDIVEIGTGGGSIAYLDTSGALNVGPRSAGSSPGPACYGLGGIHPTVTDANLVAGKLDPHGFLGGEMDLHLEAAEESLAPLAMSMRLSVPDVANGILRMANALMAQAISKITVERGYDPRDAALIAYGGAGPVHATAVARELGMRKVVIPRAPGQFSALGMLTTDVRYDYAQTFVSPLDVLTPSALEERFVELEAAARGQLEGDVDGSPIESARRLDMRYLGQFHTLAIPAPGRIASVEDLSTLSGAFHRAHDSTYGHSAESEATEVIGIRLSAFVRVLKPKVQLLESGGHSPNSEARIGNRHVFWEDGVARECPVWARGALLAGNVVEGPAVIQEESSSVPLGADCRATVDGRGNIQIEVGER